MRISEQHLEFRELKRERAELHALGELNRSAEQNARLNTLDEWWFCELSQDDREAIVGRSFTLECGRWRARIYAEGGWEVAMWEDGDWSIPSREGELPTWIADMAQECRDMLKGSGFFDADNLEV